MHLTDELGVRLKPPKEAKRPRKPPMQFPEITQAHLKEVLHYNPETGGFTWLVKASKNIAIGAPAGSYNAGGYWQIRLYGKVWYGHRLAWFYTYGVWPTEIDHIDRDRANNRLSNLREVTPTENLLNRGFQSNNTSGHRAVSWIKTRKCWSVQISLGGFRVFQKYCKTLSQAVQVRDEAAVAIHGHNPYAEHKQVEEVATT